MTHLPENRDIATKRLIDAHAAHYDVTSPYEFSGRAFEGYAEHHADAGGYVLTERAKLWDAGTHDYVFFASCAHATASHLAGLVEFMKTDALEKVVPEQGHMTSYLTLIVVADTVDRDACNLARRARFRKNFKLGMRGWADLRLALVDLERGETTTNNLGKPLHAVIERILMH